MNDNPYLPAGYDDIDDLDELGGDLYASNDKNGAVSDRDCPASPDPVSPRATHETIDGNCQ